MLCDCQAMYTVIFNSFSQASTAFAVGCSAKVDVNQKKNSVDQPHESWRVQIPSNGGYDYHNRDMNLAYTGQ